MQWDFASRDLLQNCIINWNKRGGGRGIVFLLKQNLRLSSDNCTEKFFQTNKQTRALWDTMGYRRAKGCPRFFEQWDLGSWHIQELWQKCHKSTINGCFVACILVFAPFIYIELPVESSRREFHFWAMGFGLLTHSGAMTKNFRSLRSIFALLYAF